MKKITLSVFCLICCLASYAQPPVFNIPDFHGGNAGDVIDITVTGLNFDDVGIFQGTFEILDPTVGEIVNITNHMTNATLSWAIGPGPADDNIATFLTTGTLCTSPVNLPAGNPIFTVHIRLIGDEGLCSSMEINDSVTDFIVWEYDPMINDCTEVAALDFPGELQIAGGCNNTLSEPNNDCANATIWPIIIQNGTNSSHTACLEPGDDDFYRFTTENGHEYVVRVGLVAQDLHGPYIIRIEVDEEGDCVKINTEPYPGSCIDIVDTELELFNSNCSTSLAYDDDGGDVTFSALEYCDECSPESAEQEAWITRVRSRDFNQAQPLLYDNPSGPSAYSDFTNPCMLVNLESTWQLITVNVSTAGTFRGFYVDMNNDGDFDDPGEEILNGIDGGNPGYSINLSSFNLSGGNLVRIIVSSNPITGPCDDIENGEIEDYRICEKVDCENLPAPTNLLVNGTTLQWDMVPGATSYIISSPAGNEPQIDCNCGFSGVSIVPVTVTDNFYDLPVGLHDKCFVWRVTAVCADGTESPFSDQMCFGGDMRGKTSLDASISPNPTYGPVTFEIDASQKSGEVMIHVYRFDGQPIKQFKENLDLGEKLRFSWAGESELTPGVYFVKFSLGNEMITKTLIVK